MIVSHYQEGRNRGQIGERNKTIILLRVSTGTQPRPQGGGKWWAQRFAGEPPQLFVVSQRTQQNDRGFVALAGRYCGCRPVFWYQGMYGIPYKLRRVLGLALYGV